MQTGTRRPIGRRTRQFFLAQHNPAAAILEQFQYVEGDIKAEAETQLQHVLAPLEQAAQRRIEMLYRSMLERFDAMSAQLLRELQKTVQDEAAKKIEALPLFKGDDGYTPIKGKDYFDGAPAAPVSAPIAGVDYPTFAQITEQIKEYAALYTESLKEQGLSKQEIATELEEKQLDGASIARMLEALRGADRLDFNALKNRPGFDVAGHQHSLHRGGSNVSNSVLTTTGTINDSNLAFTFTKEPSVLIINGGTYRKTGGSITWTWTAATLTATLSSPVGTNGSIFALA